MDYVESGARVVVVHGSRGIGASRVALALGHRLEQNSVAVTRLDLLDVEAREDLAAQLARALSISPDAAAPNDDTWPVVDAFVARGLSVLLLDDAGSLNDQAVDLLGMLVERAPELTLLVATARRLGIDGERNLTLRPLSTSPNGRGPAVALLADRASLPEMDALPNTTREALAQICEELSGLPLAIELAAPRLRLLSPEELAQHLRDNSGLLAERGVAGRARKPGLDDAIDWSIDSLSTAERSQLAALAHYRGPFDLEDAAAVLGGDTASALDALAALEARALLLSETGAAGGRFELLRPLAARVRQRMRAAMNGSSGAYSKRVLALAQRILDPATHETIPSPLRLRDLRVSYEMAAATAPAADETLTLAAGVAQVLSVAGPLREGATLLQHALTLAGGANAETLARSFVRLGSLLRRLGDADGAKAALSEGIERSCAEGPARAEAKLRLAMMALESGDIARARVLFRESVDAKGAHRTSSSALFGLASLSPAGEAAGLTQSALAAGARCQDAEGRASSAINAGNHALWRGESASGQRHLVHGLQVAREAGLAYLVGHAYALLALGADLQGQSDEALRNYTLGVETFDRVGARELSALLRGARAQHHFFHDRTMAARSDLEESLEILGDGDGRYASALWGCLGAVFATCGETRQAQIALDAARQRIDALSSDDAFIYQSTYSLFSAVATLHLSTDAQERCGGRAALERALSKTAVPPSDMLFFGDPQLRLLHSWCARWLADDAPPSEERALPTLWLGPEANQVRPPDAPVLDLSRRGSVRRVLLALVKEHGHGISLDTDDLFDAGWPGDSIRHESAAERVYWAIKVLRRAGLRPYLERTESGYRLDPALVIETLEEAELDALLR